VTVRIASPHGARRGQAPGGVEGGTERVDRKPAFRGLVRIGFVARGVTYGIVGGLAVALAVGAGTDGVAPNQQGALALIAKGAVGRVALVLIAAGLLAYAVWKLTQAVVGHGPEGGGSGKAWDRTANAAAGLVYVAFFLVALRVLIGSGGSSSREPSHVAAGVLGWPGGAVLVAIAGVALLAISGYQINDALKGGFADENKTRSMGAAEQRTFMLFGQIGICARALAFALVGYFLIRTAIAYDPRKTVALDGALARLRHEALGPELVGVVAAGLLVFAVFSLFEARYRQL
jgi:Domain of Unknown Function (DUF1206)